MKILLLRKDVIDLITLNDGLGISKQWCASIGLDIQFTQVDTTKQFSTINIHPSNVTVEGCVVNPQDILNEGKRLGQADLYLLVYDYTKFPNPQPINPVDGGIAMAIPSNLTREVFAEFFLHELAHYFQQKAGVPDLTHNYDPRFSKLPRKDWYLFLIKPFIKMTYKYFQPSEVVGLQPSFVQLLDKMRGECGFPFKINSGYRTKAQNASLSDAVSDSAHLDGLAVDLSCTDSLKRLKLTQVALNNGVCRIGVGKDFIHLDVSKTLPQNMMWTYY